MKKSRLFKWSGGGLLAVLLAGALVFVFQNKTSSSKIVLADEAKEHSILLHNAVGDHACNCFQPIISNVTISNITATSFDVAWHCGTDAGGDGPSTYQVTYGTTSAKSSIYPTTQPTVSYVNHTVTVPNLTTGTTYHVGVKSYCLSNCFRGGGSNYPKTFQQSNGQNDWTVKTGGTTQIYYIAGIIGTTAAGKALAKTTAGISGVLVKLTGGATKQMTTGADGAYKFDSLGLGTYTVTPTKAGVTFNPPSKTYTGLNANQTVQNFTPAVAVLNENAISQRAAISEVTAAKVTAKDVTITWKTNIPAASMVEYGLTTEYGMKSNVNTEMVYNHDIQLFQLSLGKTYHARAVSYTADNVASYSEDVTFKVPTFEERVADKKFVFNEPNPATTWTMFSYYLYQPAKRVTIDVLTLSGKLMATLESPSSSLAEGWNKVRWDNMRDRQGKPLINGLYVYRIKFQTPTNMEEEYKFSSLRIAR